MKGGDKMKKKIMLVFLLAITSLLLVGCGGKKLVCTKEEKQNAGQFYIDMNTEVVMGLKDDDSIESMKMIIDDAYEQLKNEGNVSESMEYMAKMFLQGFTSSLSEEYAKTDYKINKNKITINSVVDMDKAVEQKTKEDAISHFEANGYTCK